MSSQVEIDNAEVNVMHSSGLNSKPDDELENGNFDKLTSVSLRSIGIDTRSVKISSSLYTQSGPIGPYHTSQIMELIGPAPQRTNGIYVNVDKAVTAAFALHMTLKVYVVAGARALEWELTCCREKGSNDYAATVESKNSDDHGVTVQVGPPKGYAEFDGQRTVKNFSIDILKNTYDYGTPFYSLETVVNTQDVHIGLTRGQRMN